MRSGGLRARGYIEKVTALTRYLEMSDELTRIINGAQGASPDFPVYWFLIESSNPGETARRARDAMTSFLGHQPAEESSDLSPPPYLPSWFLARFASDSSSEDENESYIKWRRSLIPEQLDWLEFDQILSLHEWLDLMQPSERSWTWWDLLIHSDHQLLFAVASPEWPFSGRALRWLLLASDAINLIPEWEGDWASELGLL